MILTSENYYSREANLHYMSVSQFKDFESCEAAAMAKLNEEYQDIDAECLVVGSYVHAAIEGPEAFEAFKAAHPEIISSRGSTKGELKTEYQQANRMIDAILTDEMCMKMLTGEKEVILTATLFDIPWKIKIDVYNEEEGRFADLKTVKSIRDKYWVNGRYVSFVEAYKYHFQLSIYAEVERLHQRRFDRLEPLLVAVSKEDEPDKAIICLDEQTIEEELEKARHKIDRILSVKQGFDEPKRCEKCRYCRKTKKVNGIIHYLNLLEVI